MHLIGGGGVLKKLDLVMYRRTTKLMRLIQTNDSPIALDKTSLQKVKSYTYLGDNVHKDKSNNKNSKDKRSIHSLEACENQKISNLVSDLEYLTGTSIWYCLDKKHDNR